VKEIETLDLFRLLLLEALPGEVHETSRYPRYYDSKLVAETKKGIKRYRLTP
jgi:hypothetical protein